MPRLTGSRFFPIVVLAGLVITNAVLLAPSACAQPPASNPNEICGDGTTFTVNLPGRAGSLPFGIVAPNDSVTIPSGCAIYLLVVSGYSRNDKMDELTFYKLAKFVAEHNGYVHYAWWNNLMGEYLSHPLHAFTPITVNVLNVGSHTVQVSPGGDLAGVHGMGFVPKSFADVTNNLTKAVPEEDFQFQDDAKLFLQAIRANNPNAIIVVAGHSMGGNAVARLGASTTTVIDLLAPIDPVGNRSRPVGQLLRDTYNWNRWRVANNLSGYRQRNCVRNSVGLCRDFDPNPFKVSFQCTVGPLLSDPPLVGSRAPLVCPQLLPIVVRGSRPRIGANVRYLYHRWQKEFVFPFDFDEDEPLTRGTLTGLLGGNYQVPLTKNAVGESNPNKSCGLAGNVNMGTLATQVLGVTFTLPTFGTQPGDPRDPNLSCSPIDGHGEIVGMRTNNISPYAVEMQGGWPCYPNLTAPTPNCAGGPDDPGLRRQKIIAMATAPFPDSNKTINGPHNWVHEPRNPNLDLVVDDMIAIVQHLLSQQPPSGDAIPPVTVAAANPAPNANGWHQEDVVLDLTATDAGGSGVKEIEHSLAGAQISGAVVTAGDRAQENITAEGTTTLTFLARDSAGNTEPAQTMEVKLDKTAPQIAAVADIPPNANGWNNTNVMVMFPASDSLSGLASSTPDFAVATEGSAQEIIGSAEDNAGNQAAASVILNMDRTAPSVALASRLPAPNAHGWNRSDVTVTWNCVDGLSGAAAASVTQAISTEGAAQMAMGTCMDLADNTASDTQAGINIDKTKPVVSITTPPNGAVYLLNAAVNSAFTCADALSGIKVCRGPVANGAPVDTSSVGQKQFRVGSADFAYNDAGRTHNYSVRYASSGLLAPIQPMPAMNIAEIGSTVYFRYQLRDAKGAPVSDPASFLTLVALPVVCGSDTHRGEPVRIGGTGSPALRYDAQSNIFTFAWQTDESWAGCHILFLTLADRTRYAASFQVR